MALRSDELHRNLQHLNGMLTTHEAAKQLDLSYWHFMHLVEAGRIPGVRVVGRWLFSPGDLDAYRRSKYGELEDMAKAALEHPAVDLTEKQEIICRHLVNSERPSEIARKLQQSRQAVHSQITLIREKVSRTQPKKAPNSSTHKTAKSTSKKNEPIPFRLKFKGHEQVELLARLVIPQFRRPEMSSMLHESKMLGICRIGYNHTSI